VNVSGLETGASWQYSVNGGISWLAGTGNSFSVAPGTYGADSILVRQSDIAGNTSANGQLGSVTIDTSAPSGSVGSYATAPAYAAPSTNPFGITNRGNYASPSFADIDNDGDLDYIIGNGAGQVGIFTNTASVGSTSPAYTLSAIPFDVGDIASPAFADIDLDGDLDLFVGNNADNILYYRNTAILGASAPSYASPITNPFNLDPMIIQGDIIKPSFVDIDGDGDLDIFKGNFGVYGAFFQENIAPQGATTPNYSGNTTVPAFGITASGNWGSYAFADVDFDDDLDLFIGQGDGNTLFLRNDAAQGATRPIYAAPITNPFGITGVGMAASLGLVDIDGDSDLDLFIGDWAGNTIFFRNTAA
jgi:hypothetical protein